MQRMREEHIELVECMQNAYREIEEESKVKQASKAIVKLWHNYV